MMKKMLMPAIAGCLILFAACKNPKAPVTDERDLSIAEEMTATPNLIEKQFRNDAGQELELRFDTVSERVFVLFEADTLLLKQTPSGSGIRFSDGDYEYTEWHNEVTLAKFDSVLFRFVDSHKGITEHYESADAKEALNATYKTGEQEASVAISYGEYVDEELKQTSAWAKGAVYENDKMKWTIQGDNGELQLGEKKVKFSRFIAPE